jgi:hypothetical protein
VSAHVYPNADDTIRVNRAGLFEALRAAGLRKVASGIIDELTAATPQEQPHRFDRRILQSLIDDHVAIAHKQSGTMATVWNVCDGCNVFIVLLAESAPPDPPDMRVIYCVTCGEVVFLRDVTTLHQWHSLRSIPSAPEVKE